MAFKEVNDLNTDNVTAIGGVDKKTGKPNPKQVEGYFLGSREVDSKKAKSGKAYIYVLQTSKGNLGVWGKTDLDRKMGGVPVGAMIRITHTGMATTPNGEMYKFKVEVDADNTIEVTGSFEDAASNEGEAGESYDSTSSSDEETEGYSASDADEEEAEQQAALLAAERAAKAAKVQALLKSKKGATANKN